MISHQGMFFTPDNSEQQQPTWRYKDVANYFGVKVNTVYQWVYKGLIPVHRTPGGAPRFVESEVKAAQVKREAA